MSGAAAAGVEAGSPAEPLDEGFFARPPREVARELIGCELLHRGVGGTIVETEAYERDDPACHAFIGRTARSDVLFGPPGRAYVYLCYGIHRMFNVVTDEDGVAAAVLVRALEPKRGIAAMRARRGVEGLEQLCSGPGKLCQALAIELEQTREPVLSVPFELTGRPAAEPAPRIVAGPRIGITKGVELPWRYCLAGSRFLSRPAG
jgi:DNA-3-methyladenine glycosylase